MRSCCLGCITLSVIVVIVGFFGGMYIAGYNPGEAIDVTKDEIAELFRDEDSPSSTYPSRPADVTEPPSPPNATTIGSDVKVGDIVEVYNTENVGLRVRKHPVITNDNTLGNLVDGTGLAVIAGPTYGSNYDWFNVNLDGWCAGNWFSPSPSVGSEVTLINTGNSGLRIRTGPSTNDDVLGRLYDDATVTILDGPIINGCYSWWRVRLEGWSACDYLQMSSSPVLANKTASSPFGGRTPIPVLVSPLTITPAKSEYKVGETLTATFTISNNGNETVTLDKLTVGGRLNGHCLDVGCPDFPHQSVTLQPGQSHKYTESFTLDHSGHYHFFVAYHIQHPTLAERSFLDENNWSTAVCLSNDLCHLDRIEEIVVVTEPPPLDDTVAALGNRINVYQNREVTIPDYYLNTDTWDAAVASVWTEIVASVRSWASGVNLHDKYDEFYSVGLNYWSLAEISITHASNAFDRGDIANAQKYLDDYHLFDNLSVMSFKGAHDVFMENLDAAEDAAEAILQGCASAAKITISALCPGSAVLIDWIYTGAKFAFDVRVLDVEWEIALKDAAIDVAVSHLFGRMPIEEFGNRTVSEYIENKAGKVTFSSLQNIYKDEHVQWELAKAIKEAGVDLVAFEVKYGIDNGSEYLAELILEGLANMAGGKTQ